MGQEELARLAELIKTDPEFRARFNADPKAAAASLGHELTQSEFEALVGQLGDDLGVTAEWPPD